MFILVGLHGTWISQCGGRGKNISDSNLEDVIAVVDFETEDGTIVKTAKALIYYDVLMPGQTSPFKVSTTDNPAITYLSLHFEHLSGGWILTKSNGYHR